MPQPTKSPIQDQALDFKSRMRKSILVAAIMLAIGWMAGMC